MSSTSIPFSISVYLIKYAFKKPAAAQAAKELIELIITSLAPLAALDCFSSILRIPKATARALVVAMQ